MPKAGATRPKVGQKLYKLAKLARKLIRSLGLPPSAVLFELNYFILSNEFGFILPLSQSLPLSAALALATLRQSENGITPGS